MAKDIEDNLKKAEKLFNRSKIHVDKLFTGTPPKGNQENALSAVYFGVSALYYQNREMIDLLKEIKNEYIKNKS